MEPSLLHEQLVKLHQELSAATRVDARSSQVLDELLVDIERLINRSAASAEPTSLPARLEHVAVQFEADHPKLAASSRRLIDLLGKVGL